jgi:peptidoglycan hydrolase FlgJ
MMPIVNTQPVTTQTVNSPVTLASKAVNAAKDAKQDDAKLKAACTEFEAVFMNLMLGEMRKTIPKDKLLPESSGEDIMKSMLDTEMTKNMAHAGGMGLADMLYRQLTLTNSTANIPNKGQAPR